MTNGTAATDADSDRLPRRVKERVGTHPDGIRADCCRPRVGRALVTGLPFLGVAAHDRSPSDLWSWFVVGFMFLFLIALFWFGRRL